MQRRGLSEGPSLAAGILLGVLGFAGNWFKLPIFPGLDLVFGSFFVMIALTRHGIGTGILASLIASSCTLLLWNHPWAMLILTAEAAFVGWRIERRGRSTLLIHDMLFWCCCGIPLTLLLTYVVAGKTFSFTLLICAKQLVNNSCNALFATIFNLVLNKVRQDETSQLPTLNQLVFTIMVSVVMVPALILILTDIRQSLCEKSQALSQDTAHACRITTEVVSLWLNDQYQVVRTLARQVRDPEGAPAAETQRVLETLHAAAPGFKRMGILNSRLITTAYSPPRDELGRSTIGLDYSDREYLKTMRDGGPNVGDVVMSRIGKPAPVVVLAAPLTVERVRKGVAIGVVRVEGIRKYLQGIVGTHPVAVTLLDRHDLVVASTRDDLPLMTPFRRDPNGSAVPAGQEVVHWTPLPSGTTLLERQKRSLYIAQSRVSPDISWKVVVESSYAPVLDALQADAAFSLGMLALLILVVVPLSHVICRRLAADLVTLRRETLRLPFLVREGKEVNLPRSAIREVAGVIDNFRETAAALAQQYRSLDSLNGSLEMRVQQAETRFKTMFENHAAVMLLIEPKAERIVDANRTASRFYGYPCERLRGMSLGRISCLHPEQVQSVMERVAAGDQVPYTATHRLAGGEIRTVEVYPTAVDLGRERLIFSIVLDVTQRKLAEKALADYRGSLEQQVQARTASLSLTNSRLEREIEERRRSEQQLRAHRQKLSDLAMELTFAEERERNRIAGELHDQVGQRLLLGKMKLELLAHQLEDQEREGDVAEIRSLIEQTLQDIRSLTFQMRPPILATAGLESAVQWLAEELEEDYGLQVECLDDGAPKPLVYEIRSLVFQAVRELLLNVVKHAGTGKATVSLRREGGCVMVTVADDGAGMARAGTGAPQKKEGGFGLFNLQQKIAYLGGRLVFDSIAGEGTRVTLAVPLDNGRNRKEGPHDLENYAC